MCIPRIPRGSLLLDVAHRRVPFRVVIWHQCSISGRRIFCSSYAGHRVWQGTSLGLVSQQGQDRQLVSPGSWQLSEDALSLGVVSWKLWALWAKYVWWDRFYSHDKTIFWTWLLTSLVLAIFDKCNREIALCSFQHPLRKVGKRTLAPLSYLL